MILITMWRLIFIFGRSLRKAPIPNPSSPSNGETKIPLIFQQEGKSRSYPAHNTVDFADLVLKYDHYVDKTLLVKDFLDHNAVVMVTRPQRWGKTINLNMLKRFFQLELDEEGNPVAKNSNRILFEGGCFVIKNNQTKCLKPSKLMQNYPQLVEKHQGKHPVIYFTVDQFFQLDYYGIARKLDEEVRRLFHTEFKFLRKYYTSNETLEGCDVNKLKNYMERSKTIGDDFGLKYLVRAIAAHFNTTIFVFIDEYDYIFHRVSLHKKYCTENEFYIQVRKLFKRLFDDIFKQASDIRGMIAGITTMPKVELSREFHLKYITEDTLLDTSLGDHFGFTEEEVDSLLSDAPFPLNPKDIKHWYRGYKVAGKLLYNPLAIIKCLDNGGQVSSYTTHKGSINAITFILMNHGKIKHEWTKMMYSNTYITAEDPNQITYYDIEKGYRKAFYGYFLFLGYFTATHVKENLYNFSVPNHEMRSFLYENIIRIWMKIKINRQIKETKIYDWELGFSSALTENRMQHLAEEINKALCVPRTLIHSVEEEKNKKKYHRIMTLLVMPLSSHFVINRYYVDDDKHADFVLIPATSDESKQNAFIIRYTRAKCTDTIAATSKLALKRICASRYRKDVKANEFVENIYSVGIAFHKNKASVEYRIDPNPNHR